MLIWQPHLYNFNSFLAGLPAYNMSGNQQSEESFYMQIKSSHYTD